LTTPIFEGKVVCKKTHPERWERKQNMNSEQIKTRDDKLLSKEKGIRGATYLLGLIAALFIWGILFNGWIIIKNPSETDVIRVCMDAVIDYFLYLFIVLLLFRLNRGFLNHISSIKLYKGIPNQ
jgi:hypothetical protein